jgi:hypothetical protein
MSLLAIQTPPGSHDRSVRDVAYLGLAHPNVALFPDERIKTFL